MFHNIWFQQISGAAAVPLEHGRKSAPKFPLKGSKMRAQCLFLVLAMVATASAAAAVEVSVKNNVGGHFEYAGFTIVPAPDAAPVREGDLSAARTFEIIRPYQQSISVGRLYTSCTCIQLEIEKKNYGYGERALITLRNVQPTKGQDYPFYVQLNSPIRVVLRHDAFVISDQFAEAPAVEQAATEPNQAEETAATGGTEEGTETTEASDTDEEGAALEATSAETTENAQESTEQTGDSTADDNAPTAAGETSAPPPTPDTPTTGGYTPLPLTDGYLDNDVPPPAVETAAPAETEQVLSDKDLVGN